MAAFMASDDENEEAEFPGFTAEDIDDLRSVESDGERSGESDISVDEETSDSESESSDSAEEEESVWSRDLGEIDMAAFEKNVGPTNILPEGASCLDFFLLVSQGTYRLNCDRNYSKC